LLSLAIVDLNTVGNGNDFALDDIGLVRQAPPSPVPLPAALPLFATGLGLLGLLAWRRSRSAPVA